MAATKNEQRLVKALRAYINDIYYVVMRFCLTLPGGGPALLDPMLSELTRLHTRTSLDSDPFRGTHPPAPSTFTPIEALRFVRNLHFYAGMVAEMDSILRTPYLDEPYCRSSVFPTQKADSPTEDPPELIDNLRLRALVESRTSLLQRQNRRLGEGYEVEQAESGAEALARDQLTLRPHRAVGVSGRVRPFRPAIGDTADTRCTRPSRFPPRQSLRLRSRRTLRSSRGGFPDRSRPASTA